jgi:hypothetical protein
MDSDAAAGKPSALRHWLFRCPIADPELGRRWRFLNAALLTISLLAAQTGALMGTPVCMPPEAYHGPARHPSADVFSFGVLAYEALTGRLLFAMPPMLLLRGGQPIGSPAPFDGVPADVASMVLTCLRVEPGERPRAKAILATLQASDDGP